jgi:hypothetical protein
VLGLLAFFGGGGGMLGSFRSCSLLGKAFFKKSILGEVFAFLVAPHTSGNLESRRGGEPVIRGSLRIVAPQVGVERGIPSPVLAFEFGLHHGLAVCAFLNPILQ